MSNKKNEATSAAEAAPAKQAEPKFSIAKLREHSITLFGVTSSTFDGAMYGHEGELTKSEAVAIIDNWLGRKGGK